MVTDTFLLQDTSILKNAYFALIIHNIIQYILYIHNVPTLSLNIEVYPVY